MIQIDKKKKEIPLAGTGPRRFFPEKLKYPFHLLDVGQSFTVALDGREGSYVSVLVANAKKVKTMAPLIKGRKFTQRVIRDEHLVRVWRIK